MEAVSELHHQVSFRRATLADREKVREFLAHSFYPEEPVTISYIGGSEVTPDDMEFCLSLIAEGFVLLALVGGEDQLVGISGAGVIDSDESEKLKDIALKTETTKFGEILRMLSYVCEQANVCQRFGISEVYHQHYLAVDSKFRGKALGKLLMEKQFGKARDLGLRVVTTDASGVYSSNLCEKLGMQCVYSLAYNEYRNELGQQVFKSSGQHKEIKTFAKQIE
ncbi:uncharacterized protein LOC129764151 [Toxorhynchites rutilus septentrionalis]|uniref:uncharacterized protein LOC129764151 n=1 Tax=Toxorhynchites rutilus septentrionalis TaxID=329112 RepID=UPI00247AF31E|nr:uncharacterized protein LOC129764151 [Toxorhynchites rutilus septentrionalis]